MTNKLLIRKYLELCKKHGDTTVRFAIERLAMLENETGKKVVDVVKALKSMQPIGYVYKPQFAIVAAEGFVKTFTKCDIPKAIYHMAAGLADFKQKGTLNINDWHKATRKWLTEAERRANRLELDQSFGSRKLSETERNNRKLESQTFNDIKTMLGIK